MPNKLSSEKQTTFAAILWQKIIEGSISMSNKMTGLVKWFDA
ncbi:cold-shock protein, partial [Yersinia enterocolitica]|nr:cold-shock protein [Yersinia enterocolitica]EKN5013562.1 cold-shock protein [Yersinia enterocolitica]EKN5055162.1 cold-shock protein [Yersinia enterocolitica]EKN5959146.1 cold-shock protein [Yersinia enterocolitica]EKN5966253.1 cold-shock protein [Yersinia enterocolitica]